MPADCGTSVPRLTWLAYHLMAFLASALIIVGLSGGMFLMLRPDPQAAIHEFFSCAVTAEVLREATPVLFVTLLSAFWLWIAMLRHFFAHRATASGMWLFWLVMSSWGAAIVYFLVVWRPGNRPTGCAKKDRRSPNEH